MAAILLLLRDKFVVCNRPALFSNVTPLWDRNNHVMASRLVQVMRQGPSAPNLEIYVERVQGLPAERLSLKPDTDIEGCICLETSQHVNNNSHTDRVSIDGGSNVNLGNNSAP